MPRKPLLLVSVAVAVALVACSRGGPRADQDPSLATFRFAVVSFPNHMALKDRAIAELNRLGLEVLPEDDARLKEKTTAAATLWFDIVLDHRPAGDSISAHAEDQQGNERYLHRGVGPTELVALDVSLEALAPLLGKRGEMLEL